MEMTELSILHAESMVGGIRSDAVSFWYVSMGGQPQSSREMMQVSTTR